MDLAHGETQHWTLSNLALAFFNLLVAYLILCTSACMFFPLKIFVFLHLHLPCPCSGFLGSQNTNLCWHKFFLDTPSRIISDVINIGVIKFPFNLLVQQKHPNSSNSNLSDHGKRIARYSSLDIGRRRRKRIATPKRRFNLRRRNLSFSSADAISATIDHPKSIQDHILDNIELDENGEERFLCEDEEKAKGNILRYKMLERALLEEKAAVAAICSELEKERAAAATAADEAMGMILRLHEEKAQLLMEAKQYQRAIEEKFAYEDGEMDVLKEVLFKREKENIFLQKELESFKQMDVVSIKELVEDNNNQFWDVRERERSILDSCICSPNKEFASERERSVLESSICSPSKVLVIERERSVLEGSVRSPSKEFVRERERSVLEGSVLSPNKEFVSERERSVLESSVCSPSKVLVIERERSVHDCVCSPSKVFVKGLCNPNDVEINGGEFMNCIFIKKDVDYDERDSPMHDIHVIDP